jgi:hypothetical protein
MHPGKIDRRPAGPLEPHGDRSEPVGPDGSADSILLHGTERHRGQGPQYPCRHRHWAIDFATGKVATPITWVQGDGFPLLDGPRQTGDGYYESMVADPEGNRFVIAE